LLHEVVELDAEVNNGKTLVEEVVEHEVLLGPGGGQTDTSVGTGFS